MKTFDNIASALKWTGEVVKKAAKEAIPKVAKQAYEDSKQYTYIDTQDMYNSGASSDFKNGYVLIKAPQVRWLYYTASIKAGKGNLQATPQWFERTKVENIKSYRGLVVKEINQQKKG